MGGHNVRKHAAKLCVGKRMSPDVKVQRKWHVNHSMLSYLYVDMIIYMNSLDLQKCHDAFIILVLYLVIVYMQPVNEAIVWMSKPQNLILRQVVNKFSLSHTHTHTHTPISYDSYCLERCHDNPSNCTHQMFSIIMICYVLLSLQFTIALFCSSKAVVFTVRLSRRRLRCACNSLLWRSYNSWWCSISIWPRKMITSSLLERSAEMWQMLCKHHLPVWQPSGKNHMSHPILANLM